MPNVIQNHGNNGVRVGKNWIKRPYFCTIAVRAMPPGCQTALGVRDQRSRTRSRTIGLLLLILAAQGSPIAAQVSSGAANALGATQERRAARGWIELEQDQRAYRHRVAPLDLKQQRQLETIERSQQLDLRALQQRNTRAINRAEHQQRIAPQTNLGADRGPARDTAADIRRRAERHRFNLRSQQEGLPFRRR
ncbi:MAG: hypothetical protein K9L82_12520 [Chromatiaceae bacterium]|nr:hypothetical protein [Chromatiaceae bacterium]MCF7994683.1 hypothetical protein [Chromatiaceae bacterium]MCF8015195.1 hypothetical protein [Chromatiaceae bacterium]